MSRSVRLLALLAWCACGGTTEDAATDGVSRDTVTLTIWGPDAPPASPDGLVFAGAYSTSLPVPNPAPDLGTNHQDDPAAEARLDAYAEATAGATELRIHRGDPPTDGALLALSGCTPNPVVLDEVTRLGSAVCAPDVLGRDITFANVQLARVAPDGPFHIYEDYVVQTLPLFLATGGCVTGAWVCDDDVFSGIFVPSYRTRNGIVEVASQTSASGPGGAYNEATYADLRLGGVEIIVRHLVDIQTITP